MTKLTKIEQNIQAILFAAGEPYEKERLAKLLEIDRQTLEQLVADLKAKQEAEQQKQNLINDIKALAAELGVTVTDQELAAMSLDQLAAKKQELANQKQLMNEIIAKIKELKSDYNPAGKTLEQLQQDLADLQQNPSTPPTPPTPPTPGGEGGEGGSGEGGGESGGRIVATGTPEQIAANPNSITGRYLR